MSLANETMDSRCSVPKSYLHFNWFFDLFQSNYQLAVQSFKSFELPLVKKVFEPDLRLISSCRSVAGVAI